MANPEADHVSEVTSEPGKKAQRVSLESERVAEWE
jgi:hypothetical protein